MSVSTVIVPEKPTKWSLEDFYVIPATIMSGSNHFTTLYVFKLSYKPNFILKCSWSSSRCITARPAPRLGVHWHHHHFV